MEIPLKTKLVTVVLRGTAGVGFDLEKMLVEGNLVLGLDYITKAAQGSMVELSLSPSIDLKDGTLGGLSPMVSILGGPKIPILTGNAADGVVLLAKATLQRFLSSAVDNGPGKGGGLGGMLMSLLSQPSVLGALMPIPNKAINGTTAALTGVPGVVSFVVSAVDNFAGVLKKVQPTVEVRAAFS